MLVFVIFHLSEGTGVFVFVRLYLTFFKSNPTLHADIFAWFNEACFTMY